MNRQTFTDALIGLSGLATASGLTEVEQAFDLMMLALALSDRGSKHGISREEFTLMLGMVYDRSRKALGNSPHA